MRKFLNLGCGNKYSTLSEWTNMDMVSNTSHVVSHNFLNGLPFKDKSFDLVYHSHVLEHFSKNGGYEFIKECYRIIKRDGIIRIVLPNLEVIAREYLRNLEGAIEGDSRAEQNYDWIMLELYDQTVRNETGGEMLNYFRRPVIENIDYITSRIGEVARTWINLTPKQHENLPPKRNYFFKKSKSEDEKFKEVGKFRLGGEIHQWMYDRFSLGRMLSNIGFHSIKVVSANESYINNWSDYMLDNPAENASLFIEAKK